MIDISNNDKERIFNFIKENDLDLTPIDGGIIRFHVKSLDNMIFYFYTYRNKFILVKYDPTKETTIDLGKFDLVIPPAEDLKKISKIKPKLIEKK